MPAIGMEARMGQDSPCEVRCDARQPDPEGDRPAGPVTAPAKGARRANGFAAAYAGSLLVQGTSSACLDILLKYQRL